MNDIHGEVGTDVERLRAADPDVFHKVVFSEFTKPSFRLSRRKFFSMLLAFQYA